MLLELMRSWLNTSQRTQVAHEPCWLNAWTSQSPTGTSTVLVVVRSVLVKDTSPMYRPVLDLILAAERVELIHTDVLDDDEWMFGKAERIGLRLSDADTEHLLEPSQVRDMLMKLGVI